MNRALVSTLATATLAAAAAFAPLPAHASSVSWGVSIGLPGFVAYAGQPAPRWAPVVRPLAPVIVPAPVFAPPVVLAPPVVYRPAMRAWVRPVPVHRPRPVFVYRRW